MTEAAGKPFFNIVPGRHSMARGVQSNILGHDIELPM